MIGLAEEGVQNFFLSLETWNKLITIRGTTIVFSKLWNKTLIYITKH